MFFSPGRIGRVGLASRRLSAAAFTPATLFAASEQGAWYDPSDLTSMFQDSAGTTAAVVDQPVGRINDKSGRGNHATQATTASKPILRYDGTRYYLDFDGVDDGFATSSIDFTSTDELTVCTGVRRTVDRVESVLEFSTNTNNFSGVFGLFHSISTNAFTARVKGTSQTEAVSGAIAAPSTSVITMLADLSAPSNVIRGNGAQQGSNTASLGTGNFTAQPVYIGRRGGSSIPFTGRIYGMVVRNKLTTGADLTNLETWMNSKTGAY